MSQDPSRKSFLAKLAGIVAVAGFAPRLLAKHTLAGSTSSSSGSTPAILLRPDTRAVARRADSV